MFNRISLSAVALAAALSLGAFPNAWAQQTKPQEVHKPAPKPGSREYTRQRLDDYKAQQKKYADVCSRSAPLTEMQSEFNVTKTSRSEFVNAAIDEIDNRPDVQKLADEKDHYYAAYESLKKKGTDYEAELKAKSAWEKAFAKYDAALVENLESLGKALGFSTPIVGQNKCPQQEQAEDALKKLEAEKAKQKQEKGTTGSAGAPPKNNCPNNGGLTGNIENVACQERGGK